MTNAAHKQFIRYIFNKYSRDERPVRFVMDRLTYMSPIIVDIEKNKGTFSTHYLQLGYEAFKRIEKKHMNHSSDLSQLLGL